MDKNKMIRRMDFHVKGMHCKSCEMLIKESLEETPGVLEAEASKDKVSVVFDGLKITDEKIKNIIKENGYEAE
ncbi:MAG: heavy-metal-associated domain-containing protein [archaeon]